MSKTVFFGGTFNPPQNAHRLMLEAVCALPSVGRVLVVPTNIPPHKAISGYFADGEKRLEMCRLLCEGLDKAHASDIEISRGGRSYSYDTLKRLKQDYPELAMLIGGDMVATFTEWYQFDEILRMAEIIAVRRVGIDQEEFDEHIARLKQIGRVTVLDAQLPDISSTAVREAVKSGTDVTDLIPRKIYEFIKQNRLYGVC